MLKKLIFVLFLLIPAISFASPVKAIHFGEITFQHAWENNEGIITQEYIPDGQTLEAWKHILVYRQYPGHDKLDEVIRQYFSQVKPASQPAVYEKGESGNDQIFVFIVAEPDEIALEYVIHRFVLDEDMVRSYQFSARAVQNEVYALRDEIVANKMSWLEMMSKLGVADFTKE